MCVFFLKKMGTKFDTYAAFHTLNVLLRSEKSNMQSTILVAKRMIFFFFSEHKMSLFQKIIIYNFFLVLFSSFMLCLRILKAMMGYWKT